jgi:hypothetical protein
MNQELQPQPPTPASTPGTVNIRIQPKALVGGVIAAVVILGIGLKIGAGGAGASLSEETAPAVVENEEPTLDEVVPGLDPEEGPEIAPTPTTLAETPLPLDPVVTTIAEPEPEQPPVEQPEPVATDGVLVVQTKTKGALELPLPEGWTDIGNGNAKGEQGTMQLYTFDFETSHEKAIELYQGKVLPDYFTDLKFSSFKYDNSSLYSAIGYFIYEGVSNDTKKYFGFVWIGTTTSGVTWIVDVWGLSDIPDDTFTKYLNFTWGWFEAYFAN